MDICTRDSRSCRSCDSLEEGIFSGLSKQEMDLLDQHKTVNRYQRKQIIFYEGHPVVGLYCVRSGKIKLYKSSPSGKQQILKIARVGEILGHSSLFANAPHIASAEAMEESDICFLDKHRFLLLLQAHPSISSKLLGQLGRELNRSEEQVLDFAYKSVRVRLVEFLMTLRRSFGVHKEGDDRLNISLSREELAQAVGASVETVVRLLSEFRSEGLIGLEGKDIVILRPERLLEYTVSGY